MGRTAAVHDLDVLWYRDETPTLTLSRLQQVEHEAFVTLLAERADVPVLPVVAAGPVLSDALLVVETEGAALGDEADDRVTMFRDLWRGVDRMHQAGVAHGSLDAERLVVRVDGTMAIGDFGRATGLASDATSRPIGRSCWSRRPWRSDRNARSPWRSDALGADGPPPVSCPTCRRPP